MMEGGGKPVLQKPPGYRDPAVPAARAKPPPRKPQLPPTLRHPGKPSRRHKTGRSCCCRFCCCLFVLIVVILVLLAAAGGFSYLWFRPHFPSFHVENVTISVFNITSRSDGTFLDAGGTIKIQATNPNTKLGLSYRAAEGKFAVADKDGEVDLGTGSAAGFTLGRKNSTTLRFRVAAKGVVVDDSVGARLKAQYKSKEIKFMAEMRTKLGVVVNGKSTPKFSIRVTCPAASLKQINGRRPLTKCELDFFNGCVWRGIRPAAHRKFANIRAKQNLDPRLWNRRRLLPAVFLRFLGRDILSRLKKRWIPRLTSSPALAAWPTPAIHRFRCRSPTNP